MSSRKMLKPAGVINRMRNGDLPTRRGTGVDAIFDDGAVATQHVIKTLVQRGWIDYPPSNSVHSRYVLLPAATVRNPDTPTTAPDPTKNNGPSFECTLDEARGIHEIAKRAFIEFAGPGGVGTDVSFMSLSMDLTACHCNGSRLKLAELLAAPKADFVHDVAGIVHFIDRTTGQLQNCFLPRYAAGQGGA